MDKLATRIFISGITCIAALPLTAAATSVSMQLPCVPLPAPVPVLEVSSGIVKMAPAESHGQRVRRILLQVSEKRCVSENLQPYGETDADLRLLRQLLLEDPASDIRRRAADALSGYRASPKAALDALATDFDKEGNADVLAARLDSVGELLMLLPGASWDESIDVAHLIASLEFTHAGRAASDVQAINGARAKLLSRLVAIMRWIASSEDGLAKHRITKAKLDAAGQASLFAALQKTMVVREERVRIRSFELMALLDASHLRLPELEPLYASSLVAAGDASPEVRAHAVSLLGNLGRVRGSGGADLVPALNDSSASVRVSAAAAFRRMQVVPAAALPGLIAMTKRENFEAVHGVEALALDGSDAALYALAEVLAKDGEGFDEGFGTASATVAANKALIKFGSRAILPLLGQAQMAGDEFSRARLYTALLNAGWPDVAVDPAAVEQALSLAIAGDNEGARLFALSLLAMRPPHASHRYASAMAEGLFDRYLLDKPVRFSRRKASPREFGISAGGPYVTAYENHTWHMDPRLATSVIAGGTDSQVAAQRMVAWVCARHRMELGFSGKGYLTFDGSPVDIEGKIARAMAASIGRMGEVAKPYVDAALTRKPTSLCKYYLKPLLGYE